MGFPCYKTVEDVRDAACWLGVRSDEQVDVGFLRFAEVGTDPADNYRFAHNTTSFPILRYSFFRSIAGTMAGSSLSHLCFIRR